MESDFKNELYTLIYTLILIRDHNLKIYYIQMGGRHSRGGVEGWRGGYVVYNFSNEIAQMRKQSLELAQKHQKELERLVKSHEA